jgi:hypothetical protein
MTFIEFIDKVLPWITQAIMGAFLIYTALKKAPAEKTNLDSGTVKNFADAARMKAEENKQLQAELDDLNSRLLLVERKKFKIIMEFTIGDPPEMGKVTIEPIIALTPMEKSKITMKEKQTITKETEIK